MKAVVHFVLNEALCDFCLSPEFRWRYFTAIFTLPAEGPLSEYTDDGEWSACDECMLNITYHEVEPIIERLRQHGTERGYELDEPDARRMIDAFFHHAIGGPVAYG